MDRLYWGPDWGGGTWHAEDPESKHPKVKYAALCGRSDWFHGSAIFTRADRIPPTAHLCGNCARIIAARTDVEDRAAVEQDHALYWSAPSTAFTSLEDTGDAGNTLP